MVTHHHNVERVITKAHAPSPIAIELVPKRLQLWSYWLKAGWFLETPNLRAHGSGLNRALHPRAEEPSATLRPRRAHPHGPRAGHPHRRHQRTPQGSRLARRPARPANRRSAVHAVQQERQLARVQAHDAPAVLVPSSSATLMSGLRQNHSSDCGPDVPVGVPIPHTHIDRWPRLQSDFKRSKPLVDRIPGPHHVCLHPAFVALAEGRADSISPLKRPRMIERIERIIRSDQNPVAIPLISR